MLDSALSLAGGAADVASLDWSLVGEVVAGVAALVALGTALLNLTTARLSRARLDESMQAPVVPDVIPSRVNMVNRDDEIRDALARLHAGVPVLAIEGDAGIGKSALAAEIVHLLRSEELAAHNSNGAKRHQFAWIDASHGCPTLAELCQALTLLTGDQTLTTAPVLHKADALRAHFASNRTVLVLDDLSIGDDRPSERFREFIRHVPHGSAIIASVTRPGMLDASCVHLAELDPSHTRTLVRQEAGEIGLDPDGFDEATVTRLRTTLGGNPALIEWFMRAYSRSPNSLEEHIATLEDGRQLPDFYARVWNDLSIDSQAALGACAYLGGSAIGDQLAVACAMSADQIAKVLAYLVGEGLIRATRIDGQPPRYTCGTALRRFVRDTISRAFVSDCTSRLAQHYIGWLSVDWENARSAAPHAGAFVPILEELYSESDDAALQDLFGAVLDIQFTLGLFDARIDSGTLAYESALRADNYRAASLATSVVSSTHAIRGELRAAEEAVALGMLAAEASGDLAEIARQRRCSGFTSYRSGRAQEGLAAIEGAAELAEQAGDLKGVVDILGLRAAALLYLGALDDAETTSQKCLRVCERIPWERARAYPLRDLAEIAIAREDLSNARKLVERAHDVAAAAHDRRQLARIRLTDARLLLAADELDGAVAQANLAISMALALGLPPELREARAIHTAAIRLKRMPRRLRRTRHADLTRLSDAPVGGD
jgi:hypothetical protein